MAQNWVQCDSIQQIPIWADSACGVSTGGGYFDGTLSRRTPGDVRTDRARFGIKARTVIAEVAEQQAKTLEPDAKARFEQLERALQAREIAWNADYLDALNAERDRLISEEISRRLRAMLAEAAELSDIRVMLILIAAVA